jgi:hypothetical protein
MVCFPRQEDGHQSMNDYIMLVEQEDSPSPSHHHLYDWDSNHPTMNVFVA